MFMTSLLTITPWPVLSAADPAGAADSRAVSGTPHTAHQAIPRCHQRAGARGFAWPRIRSRTPRSASPHAIARCCSLRDATPRSEWWNREFARIADTTRKDLSNYPDMHRRLSEAIIRIEEDQEKAVEVPPEAPGWAKAVEVIAKLDARHAGADILADIHNRWSRRTAKPWSTTARRAASGTPCCEK